MNNIVSKSKFKAKALHFFRQIQETGHELIITDHSKPVLKIIPYTENPLDNLKALRGSVLKYENPTEPVGEKEWSALK